jgi:hypothetical protein
LSCKTKIESADLKSLDLAANARSGVILDFFTNWSKGKEIPPALPTPQV